MTAIDIPSSWRQSLGTIVDHGWRKIMVIGAADRGKSTYCQFLANGLQQSGARVAFVDGDIGQKDVGPPATISLAYPRRDQPLANAEAAGLFFVGAINPSAHFITMVIGTRRVLDQATGDFVIIDTTGLVQRKGRALKALQAESLLPDVIVTLEKDQELTSIVNAHRHLNILRLPVSTLATGKSPSARRAARARSFRDYFSGGIEVMLELEPLVFQRTLLFTGEAFSDSRYVYAERSSDGVVAVSRTDEIVHHRNMNIVPRGFADNLLCGVTDANHNCLGLGIISHIDFIRGELFFFTPVTKTSVAVIQFGDIYLDREGHELRQRRKGHF
jgi:polynucleotide 5'-hydroxyl-kinase GRC3/NOL9